MSESTQSNNPPAHQSEDRFPEASQVSHRKLRQTIVDLFDAAEVRLLCSDLGVIYDDLGGPDTGISARVDTLILHVNRRQRLRVLLTMLREARPALTWDQIQIDENDLDALPTVVAPRIAQPDDNTPIRCWPARALPPSSACCAARKPAKPLYASKTIFRPPPAAST